ncbi:hypothetical protein [Candidatus Entotheonella palauensis]|uniref:Uncharacterized protein n=1 Tax=Candidatus Entotheonella gemina TaxID=1429439 RepID=W4M5G3_9BACT|nr:hypothetical protein [Candidatus Entotheonella palauensis]ETX05418.1 MAG: hypothetical protein ETSY2_23060 [Candidatus Entotheonella gemina]
MAKHVDKIADALGAKVIGQVPDTGAGAFGMARLAAVLKARLEPGQGKRPGRPSDPSWQIQRKIPMSEATLRQLTELADIISTEERKVSPMQVAAQLLEDSLRQSLR